MVSKNDETRTAEETASDPALEATVPASGSAGLSTHLRAGAEAQPNEQIGRYRVLEVLGRGGMGVVYRARDPELDRELAIKVVRPGSHSARAQERLLAEARTMAKLRHPAVVPVFDVGTTSDGVFIVMPLISGGTMYEWMREPRSWREVVDRFMTAGRGLAAAHAAGLVHRDFKPRNVLMGTAGEVLVADFGIAAQTDDSIDPALGGTSPGSAQASSIAGTPAYMAPEQANGGAIDARADQYSFCISFWEALCGQRPTDAETRTRSAMPMSAPHSAAAKKGVPAWLLESIARGFAASPSERWPTLELLLRHIEGRLRRPKRVAAIVGALAFAGVASGAVFLASADNEDPCPDPAPRLAKAWSPSIRREVEAAFVKSGLPYAADAASRVLPALDEYAATLRTTRIAACKAARVERTQSGLLFDRRSHCLDRREAALAGRTALLRQADGAVIESAVESVEGLAPISDCDDAEALLAFGGTVPTELRGQVADIDRQLDDVEAMETAGEADLRVERTKSIVATTRSLGYAPIHARALEVHGRALYDKRLPTEEVFRELVQVAAEARDDELTVRAWVQLIEDLAGRKNKIAEAKALVPVAEAALIRAGSPTSIRFSFEGVLGVLAMSADEFESAIAHAKVAIELADTQIRRVRANGNLAALLTNAGRHRDALPIAEEAVRASEQALGKQHPETAKRLLQLSQVLARTGDFDRQEAMLIRSAEILRTAQGDDSTVLARVLLSLGNVKRTRGDLVASESLLTEAVAIMESADDKQVLATAVGSLADTVSKSKGFEAAKPHYLRSMQLLEEVGGKDQLLYVMAESNLANRYVDAGDCATARPYYQHAQAFMESKKHPGVVMAMGMIAQCDVNDGKVEQGIAAWEKALRLCAANGCPAAAVPGFKFSLGGQLVDTRRDRARGIALVREARATFEKMKAAPKVSEVDAWLAKRNIAPK